jgi:hypothetical protein
MMEADGRFCRCTLHSGLQLLLRLCEGLTVFTRPWRLVRTARSGLAPVIAIAALKAFWRRFGRLLPVEALLLA